MKKEDLKTGMIVETRNRERYIVIKNINIENKAYNICLNETGWLDLDDQNDNLGKRCFTGYSKGNEYFDIVKVYNANNCNLFITKNMDGFLNLIWESEEMKPQLTDRERAYLKAYSYDYEWVAREKDGGLAVYKEKPQKSERHNFWIGNLCGINSKLFQFIKWEDKEPYNIKELLGENNGNN